MAPSSRDVITGLYRECAREPALDGQGRLVLSLDARQGHHGLSTWLTVGQGGDVRDAFESNPTPRVWPQVRGFQMVSMLFSAGNAYTTFQADTGDARSAVNARIGGEDNPRRDELSNAPDPSGGTVVAWLEHGEDSSTGDTSVQVKVRRYNGFGRSRFGEVIVEAATVSGSPSSPRAPLVVGTDLLGRTLVLWTARDTTSGRSSTVGRWLEADGTPLTPVFPTQVPTPSPREEALPRWTLTPLIGGGLALQTDETWTHGFASGATQEGPLPAGLAGRQGRLERVREGRAYAILLPAAPEDCGRKVEVLAPDGTSCGTLTFGAETCQNQPLVLGAEGSLLQRQELAHPVKGPAGELFNGCTLTSWPGLLR